MYRIELSTGEEAAFRTIEELAVAIRRGVVTPKARIWHNASSKWLPIQFHPHYKTAAGMPLTKADLVVGPPVAPLASLNLPDPSGSAPRVTGFTPVLPTPQAESAPPAESAPRARVTPFKPASPYHQPEARTAPSPTAGLPLIEPLPQPPKPATFQPLAPRPQPAMKLPPADQPARKKKRPRSRKPSKRGLRAAFIGALLIGGAHVFASAGLSFRPDTLRTHRRLIPAPPQAINRDSPRTVAAVIPVLTNSSVPGAATKVSRNVLGAVAETALGGGGATDSAPAIEAAPAVDIPVPAPTATDSLASSVVDSGSKKTLKGILKAVSGAPPSEKSPSKR